MAKVGRERARSPCMSTNMAKKLLRNTLSLTELDNKGIVIGFSINRQGRSRKIKVSLYC